MSLIAESRWRLAMAGVLSLSVMLVFLYTDIFLHVMHKWNDWRDAGYYSHGYLALLMCVYMVYHDRKRLASLMPSPSIFAIALLFISVSIWIIAELADVQQLEIIAIYMMIASVLWVQLGWVALRVLLPALFLLMFSLPIWGPLPSLLQVIAAKAAYALARSAELPALLQGQVIILPTGSFEVLEGCSGMGYLLAALTLGVFYGWMNHSGWVLRLLVVLVAGLAAVVANILRIFIVVYMGYATDMQHPLVSDHHFMGWYLFGGIAFLLMIFDGLVFRKSKQNTESVGAGMQQGLPENTGTRFFILLTVIPAMLLAAGPLLVHEIEQTTGSSPIVAIQMPVGLGDWEGPAESNESWQPIYQGAIEHKQDYLKDGKVVTLYLGYYPIQEQGRELIYYENQIANPDIWRYEDSQERSVAQGQWQVSEQVLVSDTGDRRLIWYWYRTAGRTTISENLSKLYQVMGQITGNPRASVIAVVTRINEDIEMGRQLLDEFVSLMSQELTHLADGQPS